jgi:Zn-dependent protease
VFNITPGIIILIAIFLLVAFPVHEFAHAFVAYRLGDSTARLFGRLTLNPIVHFDPIGGFALILTALTGTGLIFGWAKPTPVNPMNLRDRRNGEVWVAIAGPVSNLIMAVIGGIVVRAIVAAQIDTPLVVQQVLLGFVQINVVLAIFNLIPIPPLDGSALLFRVLDPRTAWQLRPLLAQYGFLILFVIFFLPIIPPGESIGAKVIGPAVENVTRFLVGA